MAITGYDDIDALLLDLHGRLLATLGSDYRGLYVHGSLALGDFAPLTSDVDLLVMTDQSLPAPVLPALGEMHTALAAAHPRWGPELEVSYLPRVALWRHDPAHPAYPRLARGAALVVEPHHSDWVIQRHILREHGRVVYGPETRALIAPVSAAALRTAVLDLRWWWAEQAAHPQRLLSEDAYQAYAVLSMCRMLFTLETGVVASKPEAARWGMVAGARPYAALVEAALAWRPGMALDSLEETVDFVRFTLAASQVYEA